MGRRAEGHVYLRRAVERAGELGDGAAYLIAAGHAVTMLNALKDLHLVEGLAEEFQLRSHTGVRAADLAVGLESVGRRLLGRAQRQAAEHVWRELDQLAEQSRDPTIGAHAAAARAIRAFLGGRLDDAASVGQLAITNANAAGIALTWNTNLGRSRILAVQALAYMGRAIDDIVTTFHGPSPAPELAERALVVSFLGRCDEAREIRARFAHVGNSDDETALWILAYLLEVSIRCGDPVTTQDLLSRLAPLAGRLQAWYWLVSFGRLLGEAAAMLGQPNEARRFYEQALEVCTQVQFRPELALVRLDLAELLLEDFVEERAHASGAFEHRYGRVSRHAYAAEPRSRRAAGGRDFSADNRSDGRGRPDASRARGGQLAGRRAEQS